MKCLQANIVKKVLFCLILIFLGLMSASITHAETYGCVSKFGVDGSGDGEFKRIFGIAVDSSDNIYVTDRDSNCVQMFDKSGGFKTKWSTSSAQFNTPCGIALVSPDNFYIANFNNNETLDYADGSFSPMGDNHSAFTFICPMGVAVDSSGDIYVSEWDNNSIQKFKKGDGEHSYNRVTQWGSSGSGNGEFDHPGGLAVDPSGDVVYVADTDNSRIQKFSSNDGGLTYEYVREWGRKGSGDREFDRPYGVAIDSSGDVYVADTYNHRIQKFNSNGEYLTQWGSKESGDGKLNYPIGVALDSSGNVYVADVGYNPVSDSIKKFSPLDDTNTLITPSANSIASGQSVTFTAKVSLISSGTGTPSGTVTFFDGDKPLKEVSLSSGKATFTASDLPVGSRSIKAQYKGGANFKGSTSDVLTFVVTPQTVTNLEEDTTTTLTSSANPSASGQSVTLTAKVSPTSGAGTPSGTVTFFDGDTLLREDVSLSSGKAATTSDLPAGSHQIKAQYNGNANFKTSTSDVLTLKVLEPPVAKFRSEVKSGTLSVEFTDLSENAKKWKWEFGDGETSKDQSPKHTYSLAGDYKVILEVTNDDGQSANYTSNINVPDIRSPVLPVAKFWSEVKSGTLSVEFKDLSENAKQWNWDFGDGKKTAEQDPTHTYSSAGNYKVTLEVTNADVKNISQSVINVPDISSPVSSPVAKFKSEVTSDSLSVKFTDQSENAKQWNWDFGDGNASPEQNPMHDYSSAGNYAVTLKVTNEAGQSANITSQLKIPSPDKPDSWIYILAVIAFLILATVGFFIWKKSRNGPDPGPIETGFDIQIEPPSIPADGKSTATVTISITDEKGNFISPSIGRIIKLSTTLGTITSPIKILPGETTVTATITSEQIDGTAEVSASSNAVEEKGKPVRGAGKILFTKTMPNEAGLDIQVEPASIPADGKSTATVTINIKDEKGNFISPPNGRTVELTTTLGSITSPIKILPGEMSVTAIITSEKVGTAKVTASSGQLKEATAKVDFIPNEKELSMQIEPASIPANGKSKATVIIRIKDDKGEIVPSYNEKTVKLSTTCGILASHVVVIPSGEKEGTTTITSESKIGTAEVTASSGQLKEAIAKVEFVPIEVGLDVQIKPESICADGKSTATVTIRIRDENGEIVPSYKERTINISTTRGTIDSPVKIPAGEMEATATITSGLNPGIAEVVASSSPINGEGNSLNGTGKVTFTPPSEDPACTVTVK